MLLKPPRDPASRSLGASNRACWRYWHVWLLVTGLCAHSITSSGIAASIAASAMHQSAAPNQASSPQASEVLAPGSEVQGEMSAPGTRAFRALLTGGMWTRVIVEQFGLELTLLVFAPDSKAIAELEGCYGDREKRAISIKADSDGEYRVELRLTKTPALSGRFRMRLEAPHKPSPEDLARVEAEAAFMSAQKLSKAPTDASRRKGIERYEEALAIWRRLGEGDYEAKTLLSLARALWDLSGGAAQAEVEGLDVETVNLCRRIGERRGEGFALRHLGYINITSDPLKAREYLIQSLALWRLEGDRLNEAIALNNIGGTYELVGDLQNALQYYQDSLSIRREFRDSSAIANVLGNIGLIYDRLGESQIALKHYQEVIDLLSANPSQAPRTLAAALNNTGYTYLAMGDPETALTFCNRSLPLQREARFPSGEIGTLLNIGYSHLQLGNPQIALGFYDQALELCTKVAAEGERGYALVYTGQAYVSLGDFQKALDYYVQALTVFRKVGTVDGEALALKNIGDAYAVQGDSPRAMNYYNQSLTTWKELNDPRGEAATLEGMARVERAEGHLSEAHKRADSAIAKVETLRQGVISPQLRASYLASVRDYYDLDIELLMQLHKGAPAAGYERLAFQLCERGRARTFLEGLGEVGKEIREGVDPKLLERERWLQRQVEAVIQRQARAATYKNAGREVQNEVGNLQSLIEERRETEQRIRAESPRYAALTLPQPVGIEESQRHLLDTETVLLEYALCEQHSYLWLVTTTTVTTYELPGRSAIEARARRVYDLISSNESLGERGKARYWSEAAGLSAMILGPVADKLGTKRLLIVPEGSLQYVPFSALPIPGPADRHAAGVSDWRPLIADHEILFSASTSVATALRAEMASRAPGNRTVAVFADPVFDSDDARVQAKQQIAKAATAPAAERKSGSARREFEAFGGRLSRLWSSREEADSIASVASDARLSMDFEANVSNAKDPALGDYRIVHFATHGLLDSKQPDLSCIALSLVNERGEGQNGFLLLSDIYNLKLSADLVVLSACSTALGKDIRGEGLVGLTRGFMYAGAASVMASLWNVDDERTAELMKRFYQKLLKENQRPAAALRAAQLEMWRSKRNSPHYWGAFVLQGSDQKKHGLLLDFNFDR